MTIAWRGNWYKRVKERAQERGFDTVTAFVDSQPRVSLLILADQLGKEDVAASQVEKLLVDEAEETGTLERCARDMLAREINARLPEGWHTEWVHDGVESTAFRRAGAYGSWYAALPVRYQDSYRRVWDALVALPIPEGWLPAGPDDAFLLEAFRHWAAS